MTEAIKRQGARGTVNLLPFGEKPEKGHPLNDSTCQRVKKVRRNYIV